MSEGNIEWRVGSKRNLEFRENIAHRVLLWESSAYQGFLWPQDWGRVSRASVEEKEHRPEISCSYLFWEAKCHDPLLTLVAY